jgi:peptide/nickel transport system substrate-binding protein
MRRTCSDEAARRRGARRPARSLALSCFSAAMLVGGLAFAGCSGSAAVPSTSAGDTAGGTLTIASGIPPSDINPAMSPDAVPEEWYDDMAYEPLIVHDPDGSFSPGLAVSWKYVGTGNTTFQLQLRPNVRFSDGSRLSAAGVKADLQYVLSSGLSGSALGKVTAITALGPLTLQISLAQSNAALPYLFTQNTDLGWIISPTGLASPSALGSSTHGAGPYMLDTADTIANSKYVYVRNPYYYDKSAVHWSKVVIEVITTPSAALAALDTGQVQVMQGSTQLVAAAKADGLNISTAPGTNGPILMVARLTGSKGPLASQQVRQALAYAVDRKSINEALFGKYATVDEELEGPGDVGYVPALAGMYYDLAKAKQLLAAAGYPHGFSASANCSPQLDLALVCQAVKADWAKIGVNLTVSAPIQNVWVSQLVGGKFDFTGIGAFETTSVVQTRNDFVPNVETGTYQLPGIASQYQLANAAPIGSAAAAAAWQKLQTMEMSAATAIVVATPNLIMFSARTIKGIGFSPAQPVPYPLEWHG